MATITTRIGKGDPLTFTEMDDNLTNLNSDKLEDITGESIGDLSDVDTTGITDGQALLWDTTNSKFVAGDAGADLSTSSVDDLSDVDTTDVASGDILMYDSTNSKFVASSQYYAGGAGETGNVTDVDDVRDPNTITLDSYTNISTGDTIVFAGTDVSSAGLTAGTTYYIHADIGTGEFELSDSENGSAISITDPGSISNFTYTHSPAGSSGLLLDNLGDVSVTSATNGSYLKYDGSQWNASTLDLSSSSISDLSDVNSGMTPADGDVLQYNSTNSEWESAAASSGGGTLGFGVMNVYGNASTISGEINTYLSDGYGWTYNEDDLFSINTTNYYFTFASTGTYWFEMVGNHYENDDTGVNLSLKKSTDGGSNYSSSGLQYSWREHEIGTSGNSVIGFDGWIEVTDTSHRYIITMSSSSETYSFPLKWIKIKD